MSDLTSTINSLVNSSNEMAKSKEPRPSIDTSNAEKVFETRRSLRQFTSEVLDEKIVNRIIDLSLMAPSSSNLQPWEFHWVRTTEKKTELIKACFEQPAAKTASELIVLVARTNSWRKNRDEIVRVLRGNQSGKIPQAVFDYYEKLIPRALQTSPWLITPVIKWSVTRILKFFRPTPQEPIGYSDLRVWAHKSTALAAQSFMLAARAHNLDTCPMEGYDSSRVKKIIGVSCGSEISMIFALGKGKIEGIYGDRYRLPRDWSVFEH